ncbi:MAG: baseplate hub protein [Thiobacillus sp.]
MNEKRIDVTIQLGQGQTYNGGDTITLTGLRVSASINSVGGNAHGQAMLRIFGLPQDLINQLTRTGGVNYGVAAQNTILVAAGETGAMVTVYSGAIIQAIGDFNQAPNVALNIISYAAGLQSIQPVGATSYTGATSVATIMQSLATQGGLNFLNNGVTSTLSNPYFTGSIFDQIKACAQAAQIFQSVEKNMLSIWPRNAYRTLNADNLILSPQNGMIGYPTFGDTYLMVRSVFRPDAVLGQKLTIQNSLVTIADKDWAVSSVIHNIESQTPNGLWQTELQGFSFDV